MGIKLLTLKEVENMKDQDACMLLMGYRNDWNTLIGMDMVRLNVALLKDKGQFLGQNALRMCDTLAYESNIRVGLMIKSASPEQIEEYLTYVGDK